VLLGESTRALAGAAAVTEAVDPLELKGKSALVTAHRLVRVVEGADPYERRFDSPLVGRTAELARVRSAFEQAVDDRRCRLITVLGPPGIGKSRLAREVAADLGEAAVVLSGRCLPYGDGISYWPLREIFASAGAEDELEAALAAPSPEDVFWTVRKSLEERARERPLTLVVEDIHWAEPTLLDLIEHLADWARAPLCLLCLARPELLDDRPAWAGARANAEVLTLEPLREGETEELIQGLLGDSGLDDEARARIQAIAEGNPLFVEQLVATLAAGGAADTVPSTIQALLAARLETLSADELDVLERASVIGLDFEWDALARLAPDGRRPPGSLLASLVRKELIRPHDAIEDTFNFRHMLIRDAAYERLSKERRADLHERFADWLDGRGEEFDEIVGYHLEQACRYLADLGPVGERGTRLAERAGERLAASGSRAMSRGDSVAAVNLLGRAAELLPRDAERRLKLLPELGRAARSAGQMDRAGLVFQEVVALAEEAGDELLLADGTVGLVDVQIHKMELEREEMMLRLEEVIRTLSSSPDKAALARALTLRGKMVFWNGQAQAALPDLEQAAALAAEAGDPEGEADSLQYVMATIHRGTTPVSAALERLDEIRVRAEGNRRLEVAYLTSRTYMEAMQLRFDAARELSGRALARAQELGVGVVIASHIRPAIGDLELLAGNYEAAEREFRIACVETEASGELGFLSSITPLLIDALLALGRDDEALEATERWRSDRLTVPEDTDAHAGWRRVRARALARKGEFEEAERMAREALEIMARTDAIDDRADVYVALSEVLRLAGRHDEATAAADEAARLFEAKGNLAALARLRESALEAGAAPE
jgi:tetratricopeptide (TPR) repeat protein